MNCIYIDMITNSSSFDPLWEDGIAESCPNASSGGPFDSDGTGDRLHSGDISMTVPLQAPAGGATAREVIGAGPPGRVAQP
jgi:hypothetical protein